jgi:hypothetical protein
MANNRSQPPPVADSSQYSDGHPLDEVQYLECKLILKPDRFTAAKVFLDYGKLVAKTAKEFGVGLANKDVVLKPAIREVVFLDTADFRLYNHAFILRQRVAYESGFPAGEPEIVCKFCFIPVASATPISYSIIVQNNTGSPGITSKGH